MSHWYEHLAYGVWQFDDGAEIAFNRRYRGLFLRENGTVRSVERLHANALRSGKYRERWFWDDETSPLRSPSARRRAERILVTFVSGKKIDRFFVD